MSRGRGAGSSGTGFDPNTPSDDIGWKFGKMVENNRSRSQCIFCGKIVSGGITRLKEHLAHKKGKVSSCPSVSGEVRELMMKHLKDNNKKQEDKRKRHEELKEQIRATQCDEEFEYPAFNNDSDDSDPEMTIARQESVRMQYEHEERQRFQNRTGRRYHVGGSSGAGRSGNHDIGPPPGFSKRCSSVHETNTKKQWSSLTTPEARLAEIEVDLHRSKGKKQSKLSSRFMKAAKQKLGRAVSQFVLYTWLPSNMVNSPWLEPMLDVAREVGKGTKLPSSYEVAEVYLPKEYEAIQKWIGSLKTTWEERGVSIMCDGWSGPRRRHLVNFLVYSNRGTVFHKSIDATDVLSRTADYYFGLMDKVVEEIGEQYIVQIITDNEAAMKAAGKKLMEKRPHLYWTACTAHCIDLILEDIGEKKNVKAVLEKAKKVTRFIYNYDWVVNYMKNYTDGRDLLRPVITRFATNFITLESLVRYKIGLKDMFNSTEWKATRYARMQGAKEVKDILESKDFWAKAADILKIQEPLVKVLRLVDGDRKPTMGFIYEAMDRAKMAIQNNCRYYTEYWRIIDRRWAIQLHTDLHAAGYFLNPIYQYGGNLSNHREVMDGVRKVIMRLLPDLNEQVEAINQISVFRNKEDSFGTTVAQVAVQATNPGNYLSDTLF
ncbi:uncharacterized protein LOC131323277 isoform X1 [Rhododendron vialii]|uniref:uncharacterized protein LOC131322612 isoform X1 n=2 Tax=Rhododendron vialii TaxID=182163 RepID=UPI00265F9428|nr:uncharacterized protein LOC131322612 isoform X1 [Rhododendron vialii]XP_058209977.1 uncharacterized protein LOC131322613 isoform X1 [Rhododendron vialii]XP_058210966.1 uncharacterized protein LOC131323277 isoform X1 [Rhododendron vialii]